METLREILGLPFDNPQRSKYNANALDKRISEVIISGTKITGYGAFAFIWEKSYVKSPTRSADGSIGNLNSYATFITPHLKIDFSLLSIDNYRKIMQLLYSQNEHIVQCYDIVNDRKTVNRMYFSTESMPTIYSIARQVAGQEEPIIELLGVKDYTVEMVGTNVTMGNKTVTYHANSAYLDLEPIVVNVVEGEEIIIGDGAEAIVNSTPIDTDGNRKRFVHWSSSTDINSTNYQNGDTKFIYDSVDFYARWIEANLFTLSYDYGLGEPKFDSNGEPIYSVQKRILDTIGELYASPNPTVEFNGTTYTPYTRKGWYWTPQITNTSVPIKPTDILYSSYNRTMYQIFSPNNFTLTFVTNGGGAVEKITAPYGSTVAIPTPQKAGFTFGGWFYDSSFTRAFDGTMPPVNSTLFAKWNEG